MADSMGFITSSATNWTDVFPKYWANHFPPRIFHHVCCVEFSTLFILATECAEFPLIQRTVVAETVPFQSGLCYRHHALAIMLKKMLNNGWYLTQWDSAVWIYTIWIPGIEACLLYIVIQARADGRVTCAIRKAVLKPSVYIKPCAAQFCSWRRCFFVSIRAGWSITNWGRCPQTYVINFWYLQYWYWCCQTRICGCSTLTG